MAYVRGTLEERFWAKVQRGPDCWEWTAHTAGLGYGSMRVWRDGRWAHEYAHRVAWILTHGPIPAGLQVCHHCDNPLCVRPDHLFLGTQRDNMRDKIAKGRHPRGEQSPLAKLTAGSVLRARELVAAGATRSSIARSLGVSGTTIEDAVKGRTWGWLAAPQPKEG